MYNKKHTSGVTTVGERYKIFTGKIIDILLTVDNHGVVIPLINGWIVIQKNAYKLVDFKDLKGPAPLNLDNVKEYLRKVEFILENKVHKHVIFKTPSNYTDITKGKKYLVMGEEDGKNYSCYTIMDDIGYSRNIEKHLVIKVV